MDRKGTLIAGFILGAATTSILRRRPTHGPERQSSEGSTPASTARHRRVLRAVVLLALPVALFAIYVGGYDIANGAGLGQRLLGAVFLLCGLALLIAAVVSLFGVSLHQGLLPLLLLAGAIPGAILLVLQALAFRYNWWLLAWVAMVLIPLVAMAFALLSGDRFKGLQRIAAILSAGVLITVGQTIYTTAYSPIRRGESLSISTKLTPTDERQVQAPPLGSVRAYRAELTLENAGDAKLMLLGGAYSVVGYKAPFRSSKEQQAWPESIAADLANQQWSARYQKSEDIRLIEAGYDLFTPGDWIAPGVKITTNFILYAPKENYHGLIFHVAIGTARGDRMTLADSADPDHAQNPRGAQSGVYSEWDIRETSLVNQLARGARYLTVRYEVSSTEDELRPVTMTAFVDAEETRSKPWTEYNYRLNASYGVNEFTAEVYGDNWKR